MDLNIIQPFIRSVSLSPFCWINESPSIAYDARIFYIYSGIGKVVLEKNRTIDISPNDLLVIPPGTYYHFIIVDAPFDLFAVNFDFTRDHCDVENMMNVCFENTFDPNKVLTTPIPEPFTKPIYLKNMKAVRSRLFNMLQEFQFRNSYRWDKMSVILKDILIDVARTQYNDRTTISETVASLINYIHLNYTKDLTYDDIAEHFSYHPYYLNRRLKLETGKTIFQYLQEYRLMVAAQLILTSSLSLEEIGYRTGFKTASHFSERFKRQFNKTPREYKQQHSI